MGIEDIRAKVQELVGDKTSFGMESISTSAVEDWINKTKTLLTAAGADLTDETNAINQALSKIAGS